MHAAVAAAGMRRGGRAGVIEALAHALAAGERPVLALVLDTLGSTYARVADLALFGASVGQVGWLSGGCLEPDIARHATRAADGARIEWIEVDARDDEDVFSGGATGCRGRLRVALLPVAALAGWSTLCAAWLAGGAALQISIDARTGSVHAGVGDLRRQWPVSMQPPPWSRGGEARWALSVAAMPSVRIHGAGPETPWLVPMLQAAGWHVSIVEDRSRWLDVAGCADVLLEGPPSAASRLPRATPVALVMHHNFERDREALEQLAGADEVAFIGLLGPARRRDDLLRTLPARIVAALQPRLHAPMGLLATRGAEAISMSVALQLQQFEDTRRAITQAAVAA